MGGVKGQGDVKTGWVVRRWRNMLNRYTMCSSIPSLHVVQAKLAGWMGRDVGM